MCSHVIQLKAAAKCKDGFLCRKLFYLHIVSKSKKTKRLTAYQSAQKPWEQHILRARASSTEGHELTLKRLFPSLYSLHLCLQKKK